MDNKIKFQQNITCYQFLLQCIPLERDLRFYPKMLHAKYLAEIGSVVEKEKMASHQEKEKVIYLEHILLLQLIIKRKKYCISDPCIYVMHLNSVHLGV